MSSNRLSSWRQPLPGLLNNAVAADLITQALGVEHDWSLQLGRPAPLVSQYKNQFALTLDGRSKATWNGNGGIVLFDLARYPQEQAGFLEKRGSLEVARERFEQQTAKGSTDGIPVAADAELIEALRALGYVADEEDAN